MYNETEKQDEKVKQNIIASIFRRRTRRLLNDTEIEFQKYLDVFSIYYIIFLICGILFAVVQSFTIFHCSKILGILFILYGLIHFYFFHCRRTFSFYRFSILYTILSIALGISLVFIQSIPTLFILVGIFMILSLIERVMESFTIYQIHDGSFSVLLVDTILSIVLAILFMVNPFEQLEYMEVFGIFSILFSILHLSEQSILQRRISEFVGCFD